MDPAGRSPSGAAPAADAAAFLEGRPIAARAPTLGYVLTLAIKRRRALFGAIVAALVAMVVATLAYVSRERELRARAEEARRQAEQASDEARRARDEVERRETELLEQHGRRELLGGQPARAAVLLSEAYRRAPTNTALAMLVTEALERGVAPFVALAGHTGAVTSVRFSPGGARAVTASEDGTVRVWDSYTGRLLHRLDPDSPVLVVRWWGPRHLMGLDARQRLWVAALEPRPRLLGPLDRATWERAVREAVDLEPPLPWRARSGRRPLASDGRLAVAGDGRRVRIEEGGALRVELAGHGDDVIAADLGPSGRLLTAAADGSVGSWQLARSSARLLGPVGHGITAAFSPDGRLVAAESLSRAEDGAEVERARGCMAGEGVWGGRFVRARFAADGSRFIAFHYRATVCSAAGALLAHDLGRSEVHAVALGPDGKLAVTGEQDHAANIWDAGTGRHLAELSPQAGPVVDVAVSPSGRVVATASGAEVGLWTAAGKHVATLSGHEGLVQAIAFSPDGRMLASVSGDRTARLWSVAEPERPPRVLRDHGDALVAASFSGDGKRLVVCGYDHRATVWGVPTGELHARLEGPEGHAGPVLGCLLARAGERAFTSSTDGTVKIWDVEGGRILTTLPSQGGPVISMDLSADGRRLVTANPAEDDCSTAPGAGRPRLWDVGPDAGHLGAPQEAQPTPDEVARRVSELVPWRLRGGRLVPAEVLPAGGDARVER
jgi:WD40 repeat protein